jgi:hypothetical protein
MLFEKSQKYITSESIMDNMSKKTPTKAQLNNKPNKSELSFLLTCKVEIFELSKIRTEVTTFIKKPFG